MKWWNRLKDWKRKYLEKPNSLAVMPTRSRPKLWDKNYIFLVCLWAMSFNFITESCKEQNSTKDWFSLQNHQWIHLMTDVSSRKITCLVVLHIHQHHLRRRGTKPMQTASEHTWIGIPVHCHNRGEQSF